MMLWPEASIMGVSRDNLMVTLHCSKKLVQNNLQRIQFRQSKQLTQIRIIRKKNLIKKIVHEKKLTNWIQFANIVFFVSTTLLISTLRSQIVLVNAQYQYLNEVANIRNDSDKHEPPPGPQQFLGANYPIRPNYLVRNPPHRADVTGSNTFSSHQPNELDSRLSKLCQQTSSLLASVLPAPFGGQKRSILCQFFDSKKPSQPPIMSPERIVHQLNRPVYPIIPQMKTTYAMNNDPKYMRQLAALNVQESFEYNSSNQAGDLKASSSILHDSHTSQKTSAKLVKPSESYEMDNLGQVRQNQLVKEISHLNSESNSGKSAHSVIHNKSTPNAVPFNGKYQKDDNRSKKLESFTLPTSQRFSVTPSQIQTSGWKVMNDYRKETTTSPKLTSSPGSISKEVSKTIKSNITIDHVNGTDSIQLSSHSINEKNFNTSTSLNSKSKVMLNRATTRMDLNKVSTSTTIKPDEANGGDKTLYSNISVNLNDHVKNDHDSPMTSQNLHGNATLNLSVENQSTTAKGESYDIGRESFISSRDNLSLPQNKDDSLQQRHEEIVIASINNLTRLAFGNQIRDTVIAINRLIEQQQQLSNVRKLNNASMTIDQKPQHSLARNVTIRREKGNNHKNNLEPQVKILGSKNKPNSNSKNLKTSSVHSKKSSAAEKEGHGGHLVRSTTNGTAEIISNISRQSGQTSDKKDEITSHSKEVFVTSTKRFVTTKSTTPSGSEMRTKVHRVEGDRMLPLNERKVTTSSPSALKKQIVREISRNSKSISAPSANLQTLAYTSKPRKSAMRTTQRVLEKNTSPTTSVLIDLSKNVSNSFERLSPSEQKQHDYQQRSESSPQPFARLLRTTSIIPYNHQFSRIRGSSNNSDKSDYNPSYMYKKKTNQVSDKTEKSYTTYSWLTPEDNYFTEAAQIYSNGDWTTRKSSPQTKISTTRINMMNQMTTAKPTTVAANLWKEFLNSNVSESSNRPMDLIRTNSVTQPSFKSVSSNTSSLQVNDPLMTLKMFLKSESRKLNNGIVLAGKTTLPPPVSTISTKDNSSTSESTNYQSSELNNIKTTVPSITNNLHSTTVRALDLKNRNPLIITYDSGSSNSTQVDSKTNITELEISPMIMTTSGPGATTPMPTLATTDISDNSLNNSTTISYTGGINGASTMFKSPSTLVSLLTLNDDKDNNERVTIVSRPNMMTMDNNNKYTTTMIWTNGETTLPFKQYETMPQTATTGEFFDSETIAQWPERYQTMAAKSTVGFTLDPTTTTTTTNSLASTSKRDQLTTRQDKSSEFYTIKRSDEQSTTRSFLKLSDKIIGYEPNTTTPLDAFSGNGNIAKVQLYEYLPNNHKLTTPIMQQDNSDTESTVTRRHDYDQTGAESHDVHSRSYQSDPYKFSQLNFNTPQGYTLVGEITPSQDGDDIEQYNDRDKLVKEHNNMTLKTSLRPPYLHAQQHLPNNNQQSSIGSYNEDRAVPYVSLKLYEQLFSPKPSNSNRDLSNDEFMRHRLSPTSSIISGPTVREYPINIDNEDNITSSKYHDNYSSKGLNTTKGLNNLLYSFYPELDDDYGIATEEFRKRDRRNQSLGNWLNWREEERNRAASLYRISSIRHQVPSPITTVYSYSNNVNNYNTDSESGNGLPMINDRSDQDGFRLRNISSLLRQRFVQKDELNARLSGKSFNRNLNNNRGNPFSEDNDQITNQQSKSKEDFISRLQRLRFSRLLDSERRIDIDADKLPETSLERSDNDEALEHVAMRADGTKTLDRKVMNTSNYGLNPPNDDLTDRPLVLNDRENSTNMIVNFKNRQDTLSFNSSTVMNVSNNDPIVSSQIDRGNAPDDKPTFDCTNKVVGFYPDLDTVCQKFFHCSSTGHMLTFNCPRQTRFHKTSLKCLPWYDVNCDVITLAFRMKS